MIGVFICIGVWIVYGVFKAITGYHNSELTQEYKRHAKNRGESTYYDYNANCTRSVRTGEKCTQLYGIDTEGHQYSYIATKPKYGPQKIHDLKYTNPKYGKRVKVDPETYARWKRNGSI